MMRSFARVLLFSLVLLAFVLVGSGGLAGASLAGYGYYQTHTITGSSDCNLTSMQIYFDVYSTSGTSTGQTIFLQGHASSFPYDIRFADSGDNLYSCWMDPTTNNSTYARYWVNLTSIPKSPGTLTFNIWYGKAAGSGISNITNTMVFGDDFSVDASVDWTNRWQSTDHASYTLNGGLLNLAAPSATTKLLNTKYSYSNVIVEIREKNPTAQSFYNTFKDVTATYDGKDAATLNWPPTSELTSFLNNVREDYTYSADTTNFINIKYTCPASGSAIIQYYKLGSLVRTYTAAPAYRTFYPALFQWSSGTSYISYLFIHNYTANMPTQGSYGAESTPLAPPAANFSSDSTSGLNPKTIQFWDNSSNGPTSWAWSWGDGTANGSTQTPTHTYTSPGTYTVVLTATNSAGAGSISRSGYVTITPGYSQTYAYVITHNMTGSPDIALSSYPVKFIIFSGSGNSSGNVVFLNSVSLAFPYDIRFANSGDQPLPYWIESSNATSATYWVGLDSIGQGAAYQLKIYYGKSGDTGISDPQSIATFYEPFDNMTRWTRTLSGGASSVSNGILNTSAPNTGVNEEYLQQTNAVSVTSPYMGLRLIANMSVNQYGVSSLGESNFNLNSYNGGSYVGRIYAAWDKTSNVGKFIGDPSGPTGSIIGMSANTRADVEMTLAGSRANASVNGAGAVSLSNTLPTYNGMKAGFYNVQPAAGIFAEYVDWLIEMPYTANEPSHGGYVAPSVPPVADFAGNVTIGVAPLCVQFSDLSSNTPTSWSWSFGDGTSNSTAPNPVHTFSAVGNYTVILSVTNGAGSSAAAKGGYISVGAAPVAGFMASPTSGYVPLNVSFTDGSSGNISSYLWDFGDGTGANPTVNSFTLAANNGNSWPMPNIYYPQAVMYNGTHKRIYCVYNGFSNGQNCTDVIYYDFDSGSWSAPSLVSYISTDQHENAVIAVNASGYIVVAYIPDTDDPIYAEGQIFKVTSSSSEDISSWTSPVNFGDGYYTKLITNPNNLNQMYLFYCDIYYHSKWYVKKSLDGGVTWTTTQYIDFPQQEGYVFYTMVSDYDAANGRIYATSVRAVRQNLCRYNIYEYYYNVADGHIYNQYGFDMTTYCGGALNFAAIDNMQAPGTPGLKVYDTYSQSSLMDQGMIHVDNNGYPYILTMGGGVNGATVGNHTYYVTRWTGSSWIAAIPVADSTSKILFQDRGDFYFDSSNNMHIFGATSNVSQQYGGTEREWIYYPVSNTSVMASQIASENTAANGYPYLNPVVVKGTPYPVVMIPQWWFNATHTYATNCGVYMYTEQPQTFSGNVSHVYNSPGIFSVSLKVVNAYGNNTLLRSNYISVGVPAAPVANFSSNVSSGFAPLCVQFNDTSTGATSWSWSFGDGTSNSTAQNPVHTFTTMGNRTVTLTVSNSGGSSSRSSVVQVKKLPVAGFSASLTSGVAQMTVAFSDASTDATSWSWSFGDGATSTEQSPQHTYNTGGTFSVNLTVSNPYGSNALNRSGYIVVSGAASGYIVQLQTYPGGAFATNGIAVSVTDGLGNLVNQASTDSNGRCSVYLGPNPVAGTYHVYLQKSGLQDVILTFDPTSYQPYTIPLTVTVYQATGVSYFYVDGIVTRNDGSNTPIDNVLVMVNYPNGSLAASQTSGTVTMVSGRYHILIPNGPPTGVYSIVGMSQNLESVYGTFGYYGGTLITYNLLMNYSGEYYVKGYVRDVAGNGLPYASVQLYQNGSSKSGASADGSGYYFILANSLSPGQFSITAKLSGYQDGTNYASFPNGFNQSGILWSNFSLAVRAVTPTPTPIPNSLYTYQVAINQPGTFTIHLQSPTDPDFQDYVVTTSGGDVWTYGLGNTPAWGDYVVTVSGDGYRDQSWTFTMPSDFYSSDGVHYNTWHIFVMPRINPTPTVELPDTYFVDLTVNGANGDDSGFGYNLVSPDLYSVLGSYNGGPVSIQLRTVSIPPDGDYTLKVTKAGYDSQEVTINKPADFTTSDGDLALYKTWHAAVTINMQLSGGPGSTVTPAPGEGASPYVSLTPSQREEMKNNSVNLFVMIIVPLFGLFGVFILFDIINRGMK